MKIHRCEQSDDPYPIPGSELMDQPEGVYQASESPPFILVADHHGKKYVITARDGEMRVTFRPGNTPGDEFSYRRLPNARVCLEIRGDK